ncbi:SpaA isopeptide-forming pilin-related protein [uncultured Ruminococcus sp.]|uniref:SpaA isopeptide-forming pilin-related protein n=1 Tax=uncultured Ruminococcus sp. TaxID=165186 RepID=UPI0025F86512|nr:SpaA isopeptide-forming pilin-related protein [uncultured Ruminococcus sp.]
MNIKINKLFKRGVSGALAAAMGLSTLATSVSAASSGISIGYTWDSSVNPTIYTSKYANSNGVSGQFVKYGEQLCRFVPSSGNDWAFCIEPAKSMQGTPSGTWYTQYGFTEYDTFDLSDKFKADSTAYWNSLGGTDGDIAKYMGLVQYYGYSSHKNGNYYAATQLLIWEIILGYRGHTPETFGTCSDILWNDFTYPSGGWCSKSGVETAYNSIVADVKSHYTLPGIMEKSAALAKEDPRIMKFKTDKMRYEATFKIKTAFIKKDALEHNYSTFKSKLTEMVKERFSGTYGTDYGIDTSTDGEYSVFVVWSNERPFTSTSSGGVYSTSAIEMQIMSGLAESESLFASSNYQTCLLSTKLDSVKGYTAIGCYNEPNLTVEKTYTDSGNNAITATALSDLLDKTTFVVSTTIDGTKYYVVADLNSAGTGYYFSHYTNSIVNATKFKTLNKTSNKGTFTVCDLPTSMSSGRTYTVTEYSVPDNDRYEKLTKSVSLPSPTSDFTTNAGTGTVKLNNNEEGYDAKVGTATLDKVVHNGDGKALSSDNESDIATLAGIYKTTKFIVGYWDGTTMRYLTNGYLSAKDAFSGNLDDLNNFNDTAYKTGDGMYYAPTKLDSEHKVVFDSSRTSTDISKAYVFDAGSNYSGSDTCDYFGQVYLNLLPLNASGVSQEIVFIEVNGAKGYGYDDDIDVSKAVNLSTLGSVSDKRNINGVMKNDTSSSYTVTDASGSKYVISEGKYYPISGNKLESNKLHSDAEIVNELVNYELVLTKKDDSDTLLAGATYGLYNSNKKLLKTATTGTDGKAKFSYNLIPNTDYYVHEITAPAGYVQDTEYYKINRENAVGNDLDTFQNSKLSDFGYEVKDKPYELKIELNKYDIINDISIEGITFDITLDGKPITSITTDKNGYASASELPLGKLNGDTFSNVYTVTERENDKYIMLDENGNASREIKIVTTLDDIESKTNPVITYTADIPNTLQLVDLKVHKKDCFDNAVKGVSFDIAPTQDVVFNGKTVQKAGEVIGTLTTDTNGVASSEYIEYASDGTQGYEKVLPIYPNFEYAITETSAPEPYIVPKENVTTFTAGSEKADTLTIPHEVTISDDVQTGVLDVYKTDNGTKQPLANAVFEVRAAKDFSIGSKQLHKAGDLICTMTTGADGHADSGDAEMYIGAEYTLTEINAPEGYTLNSDSKTFTFNFAGNEFEYTKLGIDFDNTSQQGKISVHKTGEIFSAVTALGSAISIDEDGTVHEAGYNIYTPHFASGFLSGAEFEVTAAEDIITADGTVRANKGDVVATITTDNKGYAETPLLYLGKYTVTETKAAFGYVNNHEPQIVELTYAGQEVAIRDTVNTDFSNDYQGVSIHLTKFMEHDETYGVGSSEDAKNVVFGLYADEALVAENGSSIPKDGLVDYASVGEDMTVRFGQKLPFGRYYIQEISTDDKYVISGEKHIVTFEYAGQDIEVVDIDGGTFVNEIKRGSVKGVKVNEHDEPLANAVFGLFKADAETFDSASAIVTAISDENGNFGFDEIPYGKYIVTEIAAPAGYVFSDKKYDVVISENEQVVEITAINSATHLNVSKKDIYGNELKGASMQILDSEGNIFTEWVSDGTIHTVTNIPAGSYVLKETASPAGFVIATTINFSIDENNVVTVENVDALSTDENGNSTITMVDDTTKVYITKLDITGTKEIVGAKLRIVDSEGNTVDEWTSTNEAHIIEGVLTVGGTYTLHEEYAPDGYVVANDVTFTVSDNGTIDKVVMYDDTTKVHITKVDITGEKEIAGAELQLIDSEGNVIDKWTSSNEAHIIEGQLISGGTYTLHEEVSPDGYVVASDVTFTVSDNGEIDKVTMYDDTTKVRISKRDITNDEELAGATLQIIKDGNVIEEWISTNEAHYIEAVLISGETYTLHETVPADGYVIANDVEFTVNEDGTVTEVVMYDDTTKVHISKRDITTGEELPGATLQILDGDEIIEEWVSTDEEHIIEGKLIVGREYTLHETIAPEGYEIAQDITFKVNEDGSVTEVIMYDEYTPTEDTPHDDTPHDDSHGDDSSHGDTPHEDTPHSDTPHSDTPSGGTTTINPHTGSLEVSNKAAVILACAGALLLVSMLVRRDKDDENED